MVTLTPRQPSWIDQAPVRVVESIEIAASPTAVWSIVADHERWVDWYDALSDVRITLGAEGVGGGRRVAAGPLWFEERFTAWDEPTDGGPAHFAFTVLRTNVPVLSDMAESVRLAPADDGGTVVTYRQGLAARWGLDPLLRALWARPAAALPDVLGELRALAETLGPSARG